MHPFQEIQLCFWGESDLNPSLGTARFHSEFCSKEQLGLTKGSFFSDQSLNNESPHLQQRLRNWNDLNSDLFSLTQCLTRVSVQAVCYRVPPFIKNIIEAHWNVCITPLLWMKNRGSEMWKAMNLSICGKTLLPNKKSQFSYFLY